VRLSLKLDYAYQDLFDPEIDLAFRVGQIKDDTLVARPLGSFQRVLVAKASFVERWKISKICDLARVPCLSFDERAFGGSWILSDGQRVRTFEVDGRFGARSYPAILAAARAGLGVAFLPEFVAAQSWKGGDLVRVLPRWASPSVALFLLQRVGQSRLRRVKEFVEHVGRTGVFRHLLNPAPFPSK
jgi:LysR family transcriptional regulator AphB